MNFLLYFFPSQINPILPEKKQKKQKQNKKKKQKNKNNHEECPLNFWQLIPSFRRMSRPILQSSKQFF